MTMARVAAIPGMRQASDRFRPPDGRVRPSFRLLPLSLCIALALPDDATWQQALPGLAYGLLGIVMPLYGMSVGRRVGALAAERTA